MDRRFLSQPEVVAASRNFVCVRLATYEDAEEARFLSSVFVGRSGMLENTVFAILAPDGKTPLIRSNRGPFQFRSAQELASTMNELSGSTQPRAIGAVKAGVPKAKSVRLGLNIAACDHLPLLIVVAQTPTRLARMEQTLAPLVWDSAVAGQAIYASTALPSDLLAVGVTRLQEGYYLVKPDVFGLKGQVLARLTPAQLSVAELTRHLNTYQPDVMDGRTQMQIGHQRGVRWQTAVPVTDPEGRY